MIDCGLIDAAVVGGVDSLCATTLYGFESLGLLAKEPCRPFNVDRAGISIGEAAAYMLVERVTGPQDREAVWLLGVGESSDAYHMSSPHPEGLGARLAMERALVSAGLGPEHIEIAQIRIHFFVIHASHFTDPSVDDHVAEYTRRKPTPPTMQCGGGGRWGFIVRDDTLWF